MADTTSELEFTSRKISLPEQLEDRVCELANEYYDGVVSVYTRAAYRDHARTLAGQDKFEFKKLWQEVERLRSHVDELLEIVKNNSQAQSFELASGATESAESEKNNPSDTTVQRWVHTCLMELKDEAVSLEKLSNEIDAESLAIQQAVKALLEKEYVKKQTNGDMTEYRIHSP